MDWAASKSLLLVVIVLSLNQSQSSSQRICRTAIASPYRAHVHRMSETIIIQRRMVYIMRWNDGNTRNKRQSACEEEPDA